MKKRFLMAMGAFALLCSPLGAIAEAQVFVVDQARVLSDSKVGRHIKTRIEAIGKQMEAQVKKERSALEAKKNSLEAETKALTPQAIQKRPDLIKRINSLQQEGSAFEQKNVKRIQEIQQTETKAFEPVDNALKAILEEVVKERKAQVILDQRAAIYVSNSVDLTGDIIRRLDTRLTSVPVQRVSLP